MPNKHHAKGTELEAAVSTIEKLILLQSPGIEESNFKIRTKQVIVIDGVRHEIDVWVTIDHGHGYSSDFIFECKNWEDTVGKNEIIVFSEKISACAAQRGYFIAKRYTRYAKAQARKDKRIILLTVENPSAEAVLVPANFHHLAPRVEHIDVQFGVEGEFDQTLADLGRFVVNGNPCDFVVYFTPLANEIMNSELSSFPSHNLPEGEYHLIAQRDNVVCDGDILVIDGHVGREASITVNFVAKVFRPAIVSCFDVQTRGRVLSMESFEVFPGVSIKTQLIAVD